LKDRQGDSNLLYKSSVLYLKTGAKMSNLPVDRDKDYMYQMWGTKSLVTDYENNSSERIIQEIMHDPAPKKHLLKKQTIMISGLMII